MSATKTRRVAVAPAPHRIAGVAVQNQPSRSVARFVPRAGDVDADLRIHHVDDRRQTQPARHGGVDGGAPADAARRSRSVAARVSDQDVRRKPDAGAAVTRRRRREPLIAAAVELAGPRRLNAGHSCRVQDRLGEWLDNARNQRRYEDETVHARSHRQSRSSRSIRPRPPIRAGTAARWRLYNGGGNQGGGNSGGYRGGDGHGPGYHPPSAPRRKARTTRVVGRITAMARTTATTRVPVRRARTTPVAGRTTATARRTITPGYPYHGGPYHGGGYPYRGWYGHAGYYYPRPYYGRPYYPYRPVRRLLRISVLLRPSSRQQQR